MKRKINIVLLGLLTFLPVTAHTWSGTGSEDSRLLTLKECTRMALEQNAKIQRAQNQQFVANQEKKEAFTHFLPSFSIKGGAMKANDGLIQMPMGEQTLSILEEGMFGGVTASLPIFAGGQIYNGHKMAKLGVTVSDLQLQQTENEVEMTVKQYYWNIVVLNEKRITLQRIETLLDKINTDVEAAVNAGIKNRNDLLQVRLRKNDIQSTLIDIENNLHVCRLLLAQFIGWKGGEFTVETLTDKTLESPESLFINHSAALYQTTEYQLLDKGVEAAKLEKRLNQGQYLPTIALGGAYLYNDFMGSSQNSWVGMINVSVPISWKVPFSTKKYKLKQQNAIIQMNDGSEQLIIRMQKAQYDLMNAYQQTLIAQSSIEQSIENLRLNEAYYKAGTSSMSDLLDAQMLFQQSKDKYTEAYSNYEIKKLEYLQATGR